MKKEGGGYFVTFRLAGTLPANVLQKFKQEREQILQHALAAKRPLTWQEQEELFRWYSGSRRWLAIDIDDEYLRGSIARFEGLQLEMTEESVISAA